MCCFTDTSVSTNHSSAAYLIDYNLTTFALSNIASINSAEMRKIYQYLLNVSLTTHSKFTIFFNSQSSPNTLQDTHDTLIDAITFQIIYEATTTCMQEMWLATLNIPHHPRMPQVQIPPITLTHAGIQNRTPTRPTIFCWKTQYIE